jgi:hypothetical protein
MRPVLILTLVLAATSALAQCPNGNCPVTGVPTAAPQTATVFLAQAKVPDTPPAPPTPEMPNPLAEPEATQPAPPPSPPTIEWIVEGYKAIGYQWLPGLQRARRPNHLPAAHDHPPGGRRRLGVPTRETPRPYRPVNATIRYVNADDGSVIATYEQ